MLQDFGPDDLGTESDRNVTESNLSMNEMLQNFGPDDLGTESDRNKGILKDF